MITKFPGSLIVILSVFLYSCNADIDIKNVSGQVSLQPVIVIPLTHQSVTMEDILMNYLSGSGIDTSDTKEISYSYYDSAQFNLPKLFSIEAEGELTKNFYPFNLSGNQSFIKSNQDFPVMSTTGSLNLNNYSVQPPDRIDSVHIRSGRLTINLNLSPDLKDIDLSKFRVIISFPADKIRMANGNGGVFTFSQFAKDVDQYIELSDFTLNTTDKSSEIPVKLNIEGKASDTSIKLSPNSVITCRIKLNLANYSTVYGYFETGILSNYTYSKNIDLGKIRKRGSLKFQNPTINLTLKSNIGTYLKLNVDYIKAYNRTNPANALYAWFYNHTSNSFSAPMEVKPAFPGLWVSKNIILLDKNQGETDKLFENLDIADVLEFKFSVLNDNKLAIVDPSPEFITSDASVKVLMKTTIPFYLNAGSFYEFKDTIRNINAQMIDSNYHYPYKSIDSMIIVAHVMNGLPVSAHLNFQLLDSLNLQIQNDFLKEYIIGAGTPDENGIVQKGKETSEVISIPVLENHVRDFQRVNSIVYHLRLEGKDVDSKVHLLKTNTFSISLGLVVRSKFNQNLK